MTEQQLENLKALRAEIARAEILIAYRYQKEVFGQTCYCVIGHMFKLAGVSMDGWAEDFPGEAVPYLGSGITAGYMYSVRERLHEHFGLSNDELESLQINNDRNSDDLTRKDLILRILDMLIMEREEAFI